MADGISDVKALADGFSVWVPVISALAGGVLAGTVAIGVSLLNHKFAREREEKAMAERLRQEKEAKKEKTDLERHFIAIELVFLLERFAEGCAQVATDDGLPDQSGEYCVTVKQPELTMVDVTGDWRTLPPLIMYRIRELPVLQNEARRAISAVSEHDWPPYYADGFQERKYQYARLGLKALILSRRLRKLSRLPGTRLDATEWSAQPVLWQVWRAERNRRYLNNKSVTDLLNIANAAGEMLNSMNNDRRGGNFAGPENGTYEYANKGEHDAPGLSA